MTLTETLSLIETLRAQGATRVRIGDVEVEFPAARPMSEPREEPRMSPEAMQLRAREREEALLFAASG